MIVEHKTLNLFGKMLFEKAIIKPPLTAPTPMPNEACFIYVIKGRFDVVSEIDKIKLNAQNSVLMKCGSYVGRVLPNKNEEYYHTLIVHFYPQVLRQIYKNDIPSFLKSSNPHYTKKGMAKLKASKLLEKYIASILFYFENQMLVSDELLILKLKELFLLLMNTGNAQNLQEILNDLFSPQNYTFKETISAHLYNDISIEELAILTNLSISSFKRKFKNTYSQSPAKYLKNSKLEKGAELLGIGTLSISDITYKCGFNDIAHFSRSFKQKYGTSPSKFRLN